MFTLRSKLPLAPGPTPTVAYLFRSQPCLDIEKALIISDTAAKLTVENNVIGSKVSIFRKKLSFLLSS